MCLLKVKKNRDEQEPRYQEKQRFKERSRFPERFWIFNEQMDKMRTADSRALSEYKCSAPDINPNIDKNVASTLT